jgi:hypothetical protein
MTGPPPAPVPDHLPSPRFPNAPQMFQLSRSAASICDVARPRRSRTGSVIIHLPGRPPDGWLAAPGTAPESAVGPKPNFSQPEPLGCLAPCTRHPSKYHCFQWQTPTPLNFSRDLLAQVKDVSGFWWTPSRRQKVEKEKRFRASEDC